MKNKSIIIFICILIVLIVINLIINNQTNLIFAKNNDNVAINTKMFETSNMMEKHIKLLEDENYEQAYDMLTTSTQKFFNNSIKEYEEYIYTKIKDINKRENGIDILLLDEDEKNNIKSYSVLSKMQMHDGIPLVDEYYVFKKVNIIKYYPFNEKIEYIFE